MNSEEFKKEQEKGEAQSIVDDYLHIIRQQFYPDQTRLFFAQRYMLVRAITWPARAMKELGVWLPPARIREILTEIIRGIQQNGNTVAIKHFGAYFLSCVQKHVQIRRESLYEEGKTARAAEVARMPLQSILAGVRVAEETESAEATTSRLVEIADMFKPKRWAGKKSQPVEPDNQLSLL